MILMVMAYPKEFVIDNLEDVEIIEKMYYLNRNKDLFYSKEAFGVPYEYTDKAKIFAPKTAQVTKYREVEVANVEESRKKQSVCTVNAVRCNIKGEEKLFIIHPEFSAYLCNDSGKTIKKLN
jgi:hypothetical protein